MERESTKNLFFFHNYGWCKCDLLADYYTPLHIAVKGDNKDIVKYLIEQGANVNEAAIYGITPFYLAVCKGNWQMASLLLLNRANVNNYNGWGGYKNTAKDRIEKLGISKFLKSIVKVCKEEFGISDNKEAIAKILEVTDESFIDFCKNELGLSSLTTKEEVLECMLSKYILPPEPWLEETLKLQLESLNKTEEHMKIQKKQLQTMQNVLATGDQLNSLDIQTIADIYYSNLSTEEIVKKIQQELNNIMKHNKQFYSITIGEIRAKIALIEYNIKKLKKNVVDLTNELCDEQYIEFENKFSETLHSADTILSETRLGEELNGVKDENGKLMDRNRQLTTENKQLMTENEQSTVQNNQLIDEKEKLTNENKQLQEQLNQMKSQLQQQQQQLIYFQQQSAYFQNQLQQQSTYFQNQFQRQQIEFQNELWKIQQQTQQQVIYQQTTQRILVQNQQPQIQTQQYQQLPQNQNQQQTQQNYIQQQPLQQLQQNQTQYPQQYQQPSQANSLQNQQIQYQQQYGNYNGAVNMFNQQQQLPQNQQTQFNNYSNTITTFNQQNASLNPNQQQTNNQSGFYLQNP